MLRYASLLCYVSLLPFRVVGLHLKNSCFGVDAELRLRMHFARDGRRGRLQVLRVNHRQRYTQVFLCVFLVMLVHPVRDLGPSFLVWCSFLFEKRNSRLRV